mgnify:CR=1 FL=1
MFCIKASSLISSLCYSIFKLEPYTSCYFNCSYCYSRWYGVDHMQQPTPVYSILSFFRNIVREVRRRGLKPIPFRLSTLVDPFQPVELEHKISLKILKIALEEEYPLIVNTKSTLVMHGEHGVVLERLLENKLAVLQVSISVLSDRVSGIIEPRAPSPAARLKLLEYYGSRGMPIVLRLSPFILGASPTMPEEFEGLAGALRDIKVKHVVVESLRLESSSMTMLATTLGLRDIQVESYSLRGEPGLVRFSRHVLGKVYRELSEKLLKHGITFATCKEGLFEYHTAPDCCGIFMLRDARARTTLYDVYLHLKEAPGTSMQDLTTTYLEACKRFNRLCKEHISEYPRPISKPLRWHEKKLLRVLEDRNTLVHVAPSLVNYLTLASEQK